MVGSCVDMKTRVPRWRCKRIAERRVLVNEEDSAPAFMYYFRARQQDGLKEVHTLAL